VRRGVAEILRKIRCCPLRTTALINAVQVLVLATDAKSKGLSDPDRPDRRRAGIRVPLDPRPPAHHPPSQEFVFEAWSVRARIAAYEAAGVQELIVGFEDPTDLEQVRRFAAEFMG
jgi:hypothetical protein